MQAIIAAVDFDGHIEVVDWKNDAVLTRLTPQEAFGVMSRSCRWDTQHATAAVRTLALNDADKINGGKYSMPVIFRQKKGRAA